MNKIFLDKIRKYNNDVILLEGTREVLATELLIQTGKKLATLLPNSIFRSGNAPGSDQNFIQGVNEVKSSNIELVLPFSNHRSHQKNSTPNARIISLEELSADELKEIITIGSNANSKHASLLSLYEPGSKNVLSTKAAFLLRNVIKVIGLPSKNFRKISAGLFHVNHQKQGGTGFTRNVCRYIGIGIECFTQEDFLG